MTDLIGREKEIKVADALLESAGAGQIVRALRIAGPSGVGKTAVMDEVLRRAAGKGWLAATAACHRIQASLPLFAARRLMQSLVAALGDEAERYVSTLPLDRDQADEFENAFVRALEGITLDHRIVLALDDSQWADVESAALITRALTLLGDRPIVLVSTERLDTAETPSIDMGDTSLPLGVLSDDAAATIVRSIYAEAHDSVVAAIVSGARGQAMDLVAIASAARDTNATDLQAVDDSMRRIVAREVGTLDAKTRTLLQLCALIEEPINIGLLRKINPQDDLVPMLEVLSRRYLVETGGSLRFAHSLIMQSVRETIALEIPLRQRIIEALRSSAVLELDDQERLVAQAAAVGDANLERTSLLKLADDALAKSFLTLATRSIERALAIEPASKDEVIPHYTRLSQLNNALGRETDAARTAKEGLRRANELGITHGLGAIAASLVLALWHSGEREAAQAEIVKRLETATLPIDRAHLLTTAEVIAAHLADDRRAAELSEELTALGDATPPPVLLRHHTMHAFLAIRAGDQDRFQEHLRRAEQLSEHLPPVFSAMPRSARVMQTFRSAGTAATEAIIGNRESELHEPLHRFVHSLILLARGQHDDLQSFVAENVSRNLDNMTRHGLLAAAGTSIALRPASDGARMEWRAGDLDAAAFAAGDRTGTLVPLVSAWVAIESRNGRDDLRQTLRRLVTIHTAPGDFSAFTCPILLVRSAVALQAHDEIAQIADGMLWSDQDMWQRAHHQLAQGAAAHHLGRRDAQEHLRAAEERFRRLGSTFFAEVAAQAMGATAAAASASDPGVQKTTRREREIAALVADGLTNRDIAAKLVLSERTIEGHIANLFAKVNVNSRTQLATWYLRLNPVA